jgi:flagellar hook-associated protein 1 FlgK
MSLNIALLNGISGLQTNSRALGVTAQNVSNVNTEGYSRKIVNQRAVVIDGTGAGVEIASITRKVDDFMIIELRTAITELGDSMIRDDYFSRMQDMFGTLGSDSSPSQILADLAAKFQALADTPESVSLRTDLVERARLMIDQFSDIATKIENLRADVDRSIEDSVDIINTQLTLVQDLNIKIATGLSLGDSVAELQDQRDIALNKIAELMDIQQFTRSNGEIVVMTKGGRTLVDRTAVTLSHSSVSSINPLTTHDGGAISGIMLDGVDITSEISSGRIAGLIAMRDVTLPNLHSQMQELTLQLHDEINVLHNQGISYPGQDTVTGTRTLVSADPPIWTGTMRVAATDSAGLVIELLDIDLSTMSTVGDLVTAINGMTNMSASLNASGKMVITPSGSYNFALNEMTSAVTVGNRTLGVSNFLGLNDFFASNNEYDDYASSNQASKTTALGVGGTLTISGVFGSTTVAYTSGNTLAQIATAITANGTLATAGITASVIADGSGYRLRINDAGGDNFFLADSSTLVSTLNIRARDADIVSDVTVRSEIVSNPSLISLGTFSSSGTLAIGDIGITPGDKSTIQAMANKFNANLSYDATNLLAATTGSFSEYAGEIVSLSASQANANMTTRVSREILFDNLMLKTSSISGVNLDEEMAQMIILENAYAASARVITVTQKLFELLSNMVR